MVNEPVTKKDVITCDEITNSMKYPDDYEFLDLLKVRSAYLLAFKDMWGYIGNVGLSDDFDFVKLMNILTEAFKGVAEE